MCIFGISIGPGGKPGGLQEFPTQASDPVKMPKPIATRATRRTVRCLKNIAARKSVARAILTYLDATPLATQSETPGFRGNFKPGRTKVRFRAQGSVVFSHASHFIEEAFRQVLLAKFLGLFVAHLSRE